MQYSRHCEPFAYLDTNQPIAVKQAKREAIFSVIRNLNEEIAAPITTDFNLVGIESGGDGFAMTFSDRLLSGEQNDPLTILVILTYESGYWKQTQASGSINRAANRCR